MSKQACRQTYKLRNICCKSVVATTKCCGNYVANLVAATHNSCATYFNNSLKSGQNSRDVKYMLNI
eukprot:16430730-Heterocapsa_arctica.AAC.1